MSAQSDADGVRKAWREARIVLVDAESASSLLAKELPRRDHVFLIGEPSVHNLQRGLEMGASHVLEPNDTRVVSALAETLEGPGEACFISVVGACGGVGASTLATAIACAAAAQGRSAALIDGDAAAGGIELILGAEREQGLRWSELGVASGHVGLAELRSALPKKHGVDVLSFDRSGKSLDSAGPVLSTLRRGYDAVVADVPRHLDDLGAQLLGHSIATVLLVPMRLGGLAAAEHLIPRIAQLSGHVLVVGRPVRGGCDRHMLEQRLGVPVLAQLPSERRTFTDVEHGLGPLKGAPKKVALELLAAVGLV